MSDTALTTQEAKDLKKLEHRIQAGIQVFHTVGRALAEISERKLYRQKYATFQDYCRDRWGFGRAHAYRLIGAAEVISNIEPCLHAGDDQLPRESTIRPLTKLEPDDQRAVWQAATQEGNDPDVEELEALTDEFLSAPDAQAKLDAAERFREKLRKKGERQDKDAVEDSEKKAWAKILEHARKSRMDARGIIGSEDVIERLEYIMVRAADELGLSHDDPRVKVRSAA